MDTLNCYTDHIEQVKKEGNYRHLKTIVPCKDGYCRLYGENVLNLSSNDYLGLASDNNLKKKFLSRYNHSDNVPAFSSSSSRLLTGNTCEYDELESLLSALYFNKYALLFNSGYHANLGILPALTSKDDLILSDKLVHASLIDGIRLSAATHIRYRHLDYTQLENLLKTKRHLYRKVFIATESVFSMDGDVADLQVLTEIKAKYNAFLYVDEAHAVGVRGMNGLGLAEEQGVLKHIDLLIGTLGKALASIGAFVITNSIFREMLINHCRPLIYSTALPPVNMGWSKFVLERIGNMGHERNFLKSLSGQLSSEFKLFGMNINACSNIIPVVVGDNNQTVLLAEYLLKHGFLVMPIRPPTVPVGSSRLRLSLTSSMKWEALQPLPGLIYCFMENQDPIQK